MCSSDLPKDIIARINTEVVKAVKEPAFGEKLKDLGIETVGTSVAEFDEFRTDQTLRISEIVKAISTELK